MTEWEYTQYFNLFSQYLTYFSSLSILMATAAALSLRDGMKDKNLWVLLFFFFSFISAVYNIYCILAIFNELKEYLLVMSSSCIKEQDELACNMPLSLSLMMPIRILIFSFVTLCVGYFVKSWRCHESKSN